MATYTNETSAPVHFPTLERPDGSGSLVEVWPGGTVTWERDEDGVDHVTHLDANEPPPKPDPAEFDPAAHKIDEVMAWVAGDPERAVDALVAEERSAKPRPTLIAQLAELAPQTPEA